MILRHDFVFPLDCFVVNVNLGAEGQTTKEQLRGVPAGLVVRIPGFHCCGLVQFLVGELRSQELHHLAKKNKILNKGSEYFRCLS